MEFAGNFADGVVIFFDTVSGISENIESGTRRQKIFSDALVDIGSGVGIAAGSAHVGAWAGTFIPIPVVGTLFGAGVGYAVGETAEWFINEDLEILGDKSVVDWTKEGAATVIDWVVEDLPDIAADVWEAGEAVGDFFEDTGDAIGGFFSGLFS